jgi:hypothetical protein
MTVKSTEKPVIKTESTGSREDLLRIMEWLEDVIAIKNKREIVRGIADAFNEEVILITERQKPLGVFIKFDESNKNLPDDVRVFLSAVLNAAGCKILKESVKA